MKKNGTGSFSHPYMGVCVLNKMAKTGDGLNLLLSTQRTDTTKKQTHPSISTSHWLSSKVLTGTHCNCNVSFKHTSHLILQSSKNQDVHMCEPELQSSFSYISKVGRCENSTMEVFSFFKEKK